MKKLLTTLLIFSLVFFSVRIPNALAAGVVVNHHTASTGPNTTQTSLSFSFDDTGDNYLAIFPVFRGVVSSVSCTYNSVSMSLLGSQAPISLDAVYSFGLANPTTGSNTLACSWTGAAFIAYTVASVSGYVSLGTIQQTSSTAGGVGSLTVTATLGANDLLLAGFGADDTSPDFTVTTGTHLDSTSGTTAQGGISGYNTGTGSVSVVVGFTSGDAQSMIGIPIMGAAAAAASNNVGYGWWSVFLNGL